VTEADAVTVAYLHQTDVAYSWHRSLLEMVGYDLGHHSRIVRGGWMGMRCGTGGIVEGRNELVRRFLDQGDSPWLWWVDTDMGFQPDTVDQLMEVADPVDRPIVGALCFAYKEVAPDGLGGYQCAPRPTIFDWITEGDAQGFKGRTTYPLNTVVRCAGTGAACVLVHRAVLEKIRDEFGPRWYDRVPDSTGGLISEDLSFCVRAGAVGVPVHVHTGVRTNHQKTAWVAEAEYWQQAVAPPATEPTAVLVPAIRHVHAQRFMDSLRASTGLARVYAVAAPDETEQIAAWKAAGAEVLVGDVATFAQRINAGYRQTTEPWILVTGDDVLFRPGWLDHAQAVAGDQFHVVGTNDLANPRVVAGHHATHMLVRRSYVDADGASWDGPKVLAHEGYRHWFVDDEIVSSAKLRGVWAMALGSRVQHLHPLYGTARLDEVYELGQQNTVVDRQLFERRLAEHG
jgi:hypothetical protein